MIQHFKPKPAVGGRHDPVYAGMIASVDESVGRIIALLNELRLSENTLVIFGSDNGGVGGYEREGILAAAAGEGQGVARATSRLAQETQRADADQNAGIGKSPKKGRGKKQKLSVEDESE